MSSQKIYPEGILGRKIGMTQVFTEQGESVPVTVIEAGPCYVLDLKTDDKHGYKAVQLGFAMKKTQRVSKPDMGNFNRSGKGAFYHVEEIRCETDALGLKDLGQELKVGDIFKDGEFVDVSGVSIGRGFAGVVRRHGMKGQPSTRGTHEVRRHVGAIGCRKFPGRVFKNKRMPGRMGGEVVTMQNLRVMAVRADDNIILVRGGIPGAKGGFVVIRKAIKHVEPQGKQAA
jgi:large subunit ribosomal protein L3